MDGWEPPETLRSKKDAYYQCGGCWFAILFSLSVWGAIGYLIMKALQ